MPSTPISCSAFFTASSLEVWMMASTLFLSLNLLCFLRNFQPGLRTTDFSQRLREVSFGVRRLQRFLSLAQGLPGAIGIDLLGRFHRFSEHGHPIGKYFGKSPRKRKSV